MRMIFVNLPVKDIQASRRFFAALGYGFNEQFSDERTACVVIDQNIFVMLLVEERFKDFVTGAISDAHKATEVLTALSADSRAEVDEILAKALAAGARQWRPNEDHGFMYGCSFQDLDGHVWEYAYMDMSKVP